MSFPTWTLIGMGVTFSGAFVMVILAYIAQSPGFAARIGLGGTRIVYQVKTFTGYALALLLLFLGFFLAGVPLDPGMVATAVPTETPSSLSDFSFVPTNTDTESVATPTDTIVESSPVPDADVVLTPVSGAFGGPPPGQADEAETNSALIPPGQENTPAAPDTPVNTSTPVTFTPTPTNSPTSTPTPTPTVTPTPIAGETAVLNLGGGVIWMRRSPGGQNLRVLQDREVVILYPGHANRAGVFWREVATGNGTVGWIEEQFLQINEN